MKSGALIQHNPNDPLNERTKSSRELYSKITQIASHFPMDHVIDSAVNLLVNGLRQTYATRHEAAKRSADICGQIQSILLDHYDSVTGKRKNIFPHDQRVVMPLHHDKDKFNLK